MRVSRLLRETEDFKALQEAVKGNADKISLAIATPTYEMKLFSPYKISSDATLRLLWELGIECEPVDLPGDSYVDRAKNTLLTNIHKAGRFTHVLFIDSDMSWEPKAIVRMLMADRELVAGAYPTKNNWQTWGTEIHTSKGIPVGDPTIPLIGAHYASGGFLMLKMEAIDRLLRAYPGLTYWATPLRCDEECEFYDFFTCIRRQCDDGKKRFQGEDITFMQRFKDAGGDIWIYPDITFGHYGIKRWEGNFYEYLLSLDGGINDPSWE